MWLDTRDIAIRHKRKVTRIGPIIDHPHNDIENGQSESHYHLDTRFMMDQNNYPFLDTHQFHDFLPGRVVEFFKFDRVTLQFLNKNNVRRELIPLLCYRNKQIRSTPVQLIAKSKLKHQCIHKGKCPHRGMDLSQESPADGVITCPLHGLKFSAESGKLIHQKMDW